MIHPKDLAIEDFSYNLPDEKIARFPMAERDSSKLCIAGKQEKPKIFRLPENPITNY